MLRHALCRAHTCHYFSYYSYYAVTIRIIMLIIPCFTPLMLPFAFIRYCHAAICLHDAMPPIFDAHVFCCCFDYLMPPSLMLPPPLMPPMPHAPPCLRAYACCAYCFICYFPPTTRHTLRDMLRLPPRLHYHDDTPLFATMAPRLPMMVRHDCCRASGAQRAGSERVRSSYGAKRC